MIRFANFPIAWVNPARAGMILSDIPVKFSARRKPRASGDDPVIATVVNAAGK